MEKQIQISDAEWEVMKVLWSTPGLTASEVSEHLVDARWHQKTVRTMLDRLQKKGVIGVDMADKFYRYSPVLNREECVNKVSSSFLNKVFDGALSPMVAHFVKDSRLSRQEREELERILDKIDNREKK